MGQEKVRKIVAENFSELEMEGEGRGLSRIMKKTSTSQQYHIGISRPLDKVTN